MMDFGTIEILATILIAISVVKIITLAVNPACWFEGIGKLCSNPAITTIAALILAVIVLFYLVSAGLTITQILAVALFIFLLMVVGIAPYADDLIAQIKDNVQLSRYWLYTIAWILLLVWGVYDIFFV